MSPTISSPGVEQKLEKLLKDLALNREKRTALDKTLPLFNRLRSLIERCRRRAVVKEPRSFEGLQASYLTHELRAPVTSIRLGLELLQEQIEGRLAADEKQILSLAVRNTERLNGLINDIMDYSKVAAGKMRMSKENCDARRLASEAVESLQPWAASRGVRLVEEQGPALPMISAEPRRVIQVLTNLISNALKFTPVGGRVLVSLRQHFGAVVFCVSDTGCGIPTASLGKIFEAFEQSCAGVKQSAGTGLGLSLARSMVELHGGRIWAESRHGSGSKFSFTIPLADSSGAVRLRTLQLRGLLADLSCRVNALLVAVL